MNKKLLTSILVVSISPILLNVSVPVNHASPSSFPNHPTLEADGIPLPPPKGPSKPIVEEPSQRADGIPLPPPKGPSKPLENT